MVVIPTDKIFLQQAVWGAALSLIASSACAQSPDLSGTISILEENFDGPLLRYDGLRGVWSTLPRRRQLVTNASAAAYWDEGVLPNYAEIAINPTISVRAGTLLLRTVKVPDTARQSLDAYLQTTRQGRFSGQIKYLVGQINTHETWAQRYGYFEITAQIPVGKGRWPAFWLTDAGPGWPPELDIFEAYGNGLDQPTDHDDRFNVAVHFDAIPQDGVDHAVAAVPDIAGSSQFDQPNFLDDDKGGHYAYQRFLNARLDLGADIYSGFNTYAALWTPETVTFYFGPNPAELRAIFQSPTPADAQTPMYLIANDQFTTQGHWWDPIPDEIDRVIAPENAFKIQSIRILALLPTANVGPQDPDPGDSVLHGTSEDDWLAPGIGFDLIVLNGGLDTVFIERGHDGKVISGFGADDRLILVGYPFQDAADARSRLTQVGEDVWLPSGADPAFPQSIIFRNTRTKVIEQSQIVVIWPLARQDWAADAARDGQHIKYDGGGGAVTAGPLGGKLNDMGLPARLVGGRGPDHFYIANPDSSVIERVASGVDTMTTYVSYRLPDHVEHGIAAATGVHLTGNAGDNRLHAEAKRVVLSGEAGDDLYVIDATALADIVIKRGQGHDRIVGLKPQDTLQIGRPLQLDKQDWRMTEQADGVLLSFNSKQSVFVAGDPDKQAGRLARQFGIRR